MAGGVTSVRRERERLEGKNDKVESVFIIDFLILHRYASNSYIFTLLPCLVGVLHG